MASLRYYQDSFTSSAYQPDQSDTEKRRRQTKITERKRRLLYGHCHHLLGGVWKQRIGYALYN